MNEKASLPCPLQSGAAFVHKFRNTEHLLCARSLLGDGAIERNDRDNVPDNLAYTHSVLFKKASQQLH